MATLGTLNNMNERTLRVGLGILHNEPKVQYWEIRLPSVERVGNIADDEEHWIRTLGVQLNFEQCGG